MQKRKGISLIVLVITIIIMIILAGSIIITLNNSGIIEKASDAVDKTNQATVKELAQVGWAEAYAKYGENLEKLEEGVKNILTQNNLDPDDYAIVVTTSGVEIQKGWMKKDFTVIKGDNVLQIGDTIKYIATGTTYNGLWKILGADDEGNLLILSSTYVDTSAWLSNDSSWFDNVNDKDKNLYDTQQNWLGVTSLLNAKCEQYGKGAGTVGKARSIRTQDVNTITGYNPDITTYGEDEVYEYGNKVTYEWSENGEIKYSGTRNNKEGSADFSGSKFVWYDEKTRTFSSVKKGDMSTPLPTLTSTYYEYDASKLATIDKQTNSKAYTMLFRDDGVGYWLAESDMVTYPNNVYFGVRAVKKEIIKHLSLWRADGRTYGADAGVRAVVTLQSDITLTGSSETGWSYTVN